MVTLKRLQLIALSTCLSLGVGHATLQTIPDGLGCGQPKSNAEINAEFFFNTFISKKATPINESICLYKQIGAFYPGCETTIFGIIPLQNTEAPQTFNALRTALLAEMQLQPTAKMVQILCDTAPFSETGTTSMKDIFAPIVAAVQSNNRNYLIEFGYTADVQGEKLSGNGMIHDYVEKGAISADVVLANIVGESFTYGCNVSDKIKNVIMTHNNETDIATQTKFRDDIAVSDKIMKPGDIVFLFEGGVQSYMQALNVLENGVTVVAVDNLREISIKRFSAAKFLLAVKERIAGEPMSQRLEIINAILAEQKTPVWESFNDALSQPLDQQKKDKIQKNRQARENEFVKDAGGDELFPRLIEIINRGFLDNLKTKDDFLSSSATFVSAAGAGATKTPGELQGAGASGVDPYAIKMSGQLPTAKDPGGTTFAGNLKEIATDRAAQDMAYPSSSTRKSSSRPGSSSIVSSEFPHPGAGASLAQMSAAAQNPKFATDIAAGADRP